jgi:KaiC/GvpD/RAD55 family RecA-like ATPase
MERLKSGIYGLDELIEGGFPKGRTILVSGGCGAGKTIMGMQFAYRGATEFDEPSVYVTLDERPKMLREDMSRFGWDIQKAEDKGKFAILDASAAKVGFPSEEKYTLPQVGVDVDKLLMQIMKISDQIGAKRVVIDSMSGLGTQMGDMNEVRKSILKLNYLLLKSELTTVITSEIPEQVMGGQEPMSFSKYAVEEYVADGVIVLHYFGIGTQSNRQLYIRKMRGTKHTGDLIPMEITPKGIVLKNPEDAYKV